MPSTVVLAKQWPQQKNNSMKVIIVQINSLTLKIPTARYFRYFLVGIRYFLVFCYTNVGIGIGVWKSRGIGSVSVLPTVRPRPGHLTPPSSFRLIPTLGSVTNLLLGAYRKVASGSRMVTSSMTSRYSMTSQSWRHDWKQYTDVARRIYILAASDPVA